MHAQRSRLAPPSPGLRNAENSGSPAAPKGHRVRNTVVPATASSAALEIAAHTAALGDALHPV